MSPDAIFSRLQQVGECWEWLGNRTRLGYGLTYVGGRAQQVHRFTWEHLRGPIPDGLELDHLCRNRACCNPDHLDPVTHVVNMRRGVQSFDSRTHCLSGRHELTPGNIGTVRGRGRHCRACRAETRARWRNKTRAAA